MGFVLDGREAWSVTFKEERSLRVLRTILGPRGTNSGHAVGNCAVSSVMICTHRMLFGGEYLEGRGVDLSIILKWTLK